jgi:hypothetical protein
MSDDSKKSVDSEGGRKYSGHEPPKRVVESKPSVVIGSGHAAPADQPKGMVPPPKRDDARDSASPKK